MRPLKELLTQITNRREGRMHENKWRPRPMIDIVRDLEAKGVEISTVTEEIRRKREDMLREAMVKKGKPLTPDEIDDLSSQAERITLLAKTLVYNINFDEKIEGT